MHEEGREARHDEQREQQGAALTMERKRDVSYLTNRRPEEKRVKIRKTGQARREGRKGKGAKRVTSDERTSTGRKNARGQDRLNHSRGGRQGGKLMQTHTKGQRREEEAD